MTTLWQDIRFALRQLRSSPGFAAVALFSVALGIAGTAVVFDLLTTLLLQPPAGVMSPEEVQRLYVLRNEGVIQTPDGGPGSYRDFQLLRQGLPESVEVAAFLPPQEFDEGRGVTALRVEGQAVSGEFFALLGISAAQGRLFGKEVERAVESRHVAVLSHAFWLRRFAADSEIVGRTILLDGSAFTVVGVASAEFTGIETDAVDVWIPLVTAAADLLHQADAALFQYLLRLDSEADRKRVVEIAEASLVATAAEHPGLDPSPAVLLGPLNAARGPHPSGVLRLTLWLGVATAMLLLIACANFADLLLARATTRKRELAVRRALGASERRIARQLVTESVVLSLGGGLVGLAIALIAKRWVERFPEVPSGSGLDPWIAGLAFAASIATGLLFGLVPAVQPESRRVIVLNDAQPGGHRVSGRLPTALVAAQVALAVVLLAGAGIFLRSLQKVVTIDTGMDLDRLAVVSMDLSAAGFSGAEIASLHEQGLARLATLPGVEAASVVLPLPLSGRGWGMTVTSAESGSTRLPEGPYAYIVGPGFFRTAGVRILRGRSFDEQDRTGSEPVAIVSEALADALVPNGEAVGACVPVGADQEQRGDCTRIVGIAENIRHRYLVDAPAPYVYRPDSQLPFTRGPSLFQPDLVVRTARDPAQYLGTIRSALQGLAHGLPYIDVQPFESFVADRAVRPFRIAALLLAVFGSLALFLASIGLYGTISHLVASRSREVGVRIALGATRATVIRSVLRRALVPVLIGSAAGLLAAAGAARSVDAQLHGLVVRDPLTVGVVIAALALCALTAAWLPARRAARVDPSVTLRGE